MSTSTAGPIPLSRIWSGRKVLAEDLGGDDLADVLDLHAGASAWWVLDRSTDYTHGELDRLATALRLDHLAVADLTAGDHRAKFEEVGPGRLVATNTVSLDRDAITVSVQPISLLLTDRALICLADPQASIDPARLLADNRERLIDEGLEAALAIVMKAVLKTYAEAVDWLEAESDELADALFSERPMNKTEQLRGFRLRRALSKVRRVTEPMRSVMADLVEDVSTGEAANKRGASKAAPIGKSAADQELRVRHWRLIAEMHDRTADAADALRETLASLFDASLALADHQMNTIIKKLTGWAAILAVPTLVTGFVGMNVGFPLAGSEAGFWLYLAIMVVAAAILWVVFRRLDWV